MAVSPPGPLSPASQNYAINTYRYVRLSIVVVVVTLLTSMLWERAHATCWNGSLSAYYYTPVHAVFVAALAVIGVALVAVRGGTDWEEGFLNLSGFLAPVVAFVPTAYSARDCPSATSVAEVKGGFQSNNLIAYALGGVIALLVATVGRKVSKRTGKLLSLNVSVTVPVVLSASMFAAGLVWYQVSRTTFLLHAHSYSAIAMFVCAGVVMFLAGRNAIGKGNTRLGSLYIGCTGAMVVGALIVIIAASVVSWSHKVLVLELIELSVFMVYWFVQSIEYWDIGLSAG